VASVPGMFEDFTLIYSLVFRLTKQVAPNLKLFRATSYNIQILRYKVKICRQVRSQSQELYRNVGVERRRK